MTQNRRRWILLYQWAAGLCDAGTGALLVFAPVWTFHLMGLAILPQPVAFVRFVGVFVLCVGLSYLLAGAAWPLRPGYGGYWHAQWSITALIRTAVALLLTWQIASGAMEHGWFAVILTDATYAIIQWIGLSRNWLTLEQ